VARAVAGSDLTRSDSPTELEETVDLAVWLLVRDAAERARPELVGRVLGAKQN
jgi:hypothetical protein